MTPGPIPVLRPGSDAPTPHPARQRRLTARPDDRSQADDDAVATVCTAHPNWSRSADGAVRRLLPAGAGHVWLATWANGELDLEPLNGASVDSSPVIHHCFPEALPGTAPEALRRLGTVVHVWTPALWEALSTAIMMTRAPSADVARTLVRRWSQAFGELHSPRGAASGQLAMVPGPETVLALPESHFRSYGVSFWRKPLRAAASAYWQHADEWQRLGNAALASAFTAVGVSPRAADTEVAHYRADFTRYPLPPALSTPRATDDQRHALALFTLTARNRVPGRVARSSGAPGPVRQPPGAPRRGASPGAPAAPVARIGATDSTPGGFLPRDLTVVLLGAEQLGKADAVGSASPGSAVPPGGVLPSPEHRRTTAAVDFGSVILDDGAVIRLIGPPAAGPSHHASGDGFPHGADLALVLLDADRPEEAAPLLSLVARHGVPCAVAVSKVSKAAVHDPDQGCIGVAA